MSFNKSTTPKVAIIYDRVNTSYGGAEHVLKTIGDIFPNAPLFTSVYSKEIASWANSFKITTTYLQKISFLRNRHQLIASLMPMAFESLNLNDYDIIISVSSAEAKGVLTKPNQLHICYMLTPTRYIYSHRKEYLSSKKILSWPIIKQLANLMLNYLEWWDKVAAYKPDLIIPISNLVKNRIKEFYSISSESVIYPAANIAPRKTIKKKVSVSYYLSISRLVDYKKVDLSIKAALKLNKFLVVVGTGIQENELKKISSDQWTEKMQNEPITSLLNRAKKQNTKIIFTKNLSEQDVNFLLSNCKAVIMPGEEDFGITGLEASIFGKPVIVFYTSGVSELLENGVDSIFIKEETEQQVIEAIIKLEKTNFNKRLIETRAKHHSVEKFKNQFKNKVIESWKNFSLDS
ncbi:glycosyltransferase [Patescibacteria group bacterium]|nr:glycosyltransferase [Patescibacteria group bacterium]